MKTEAANPSQAFALEAPGDFLSGLLGVSALQILPLECGSVRDFPEEFGVWRILSPLSGSVRVTAGDCSWPLEPGQRAGVDGQTELTLFSLFGV